MDLSGLIVPKTEVDYLISEIEQNCITLSQIENRFKELHADYYDMEWTGAYGAMEKYYKTDLSVVTIEEIRSLVNLWRDSVVTLDEMLYKDAMKEFSITSMIGFGVDGSETEKLEDFESVRQHIVVKSALAEELLIRLSHL